MKKRFATLTVLAAMLLLGTYGFAQKSQGKSGGKSGGHKQSSSRVDADLASLTQQLSLTDDQQAKIKPILEEQSKKLKGLKTDSSLPQADMKAKRSEIRRATVEQIRPILTADQQKKLDQMPKSHGKKGGSQGEKAQTTQQ